MRALLFILAMLVFILWMAWPAKSQDCYPVARSLTELNEYTKKENVHAAAWVLDMQASPNVQLLVVWFSNNSEYVYVSGFRDGCMVMMPDGKPGRVAPITPELRHAIAGAKLAFSNTDTTPFTSY